MAPDHVAGRYEAFGLTIGSEFPLPELPAADVRDASAATDAPATTDATDAAAVADTGDAPAAPDAPVDADVEIRRGRVGSVAEVGAPADDGRYVDVEPGRCTITYEDFGSVRVEDGERVVADLDRDDLASSRIFRRLLEGQIAAVLLHQRGLLVLHGSAVAVDGGAAIFLGASGAGKTTTAAACYAAGHDLLDDDVVAIELREDGPVVRPGVPELKLSPEAAAELGLDVEPADDYDAGSPKQYHETSVDGPRSAVPLAACYRLVDGSEPAVENGEPAVDDAPARASAEGASAQEASAQEASTEGTSAASAAEPSSPSLEPLDPHAQVLALVTNTYTIGLLDTTGSSSEHLSQCSRVADAAPVRDLVRPDALDRVHEVADLVARDVRAARDDGDRPGDRRDDRSSDELSDRPGDGSDDRRSLRNP